MEQNRGSMLEKIHPPTRSYQQDLIKYLTEKNADHAAALDNNEVDKNM